MLELVWELNYIRDGHLFSFRYDTRLNTTFSEQIPIRYQKLWVSTDTDTIPAQCVNVCYLIITFFVLHTIYYI